MAKCFNVKQRERRALMSQRKRVQKGDPDTLKLRRKNQPTSVSGKRQRKLLKKWRREQKDALEKGLVTMEDIEMIAADGSSQEVKKSTPKFHMKKSVKLKAIKQKRKGKKQSKAAAPAAEASADAMME